VVLAQTVRQGVGHTVVVLDYEYPHFARSSGQRKLFVKSAVDLDKVMWATT